MRSGVLLAVLSLGCATAPAPKAERVVPAPSKVKTVAVSLGDAVKAISGRFATLRLEEVSRSELPGSLLLVASGPKERRAAVSSGASGFTTNTFVFHRRYTLRFVSVDEGHTRIEASTTAVFDDTDACSPALDRRDDLGPASRWFSVCSLATSNGRPNVDVVDSREQRWIAGIEDGEEPLGLLMAE